MPILRYFANLSAGKTVLWCYLIWYLASAFALFDPAPAIWLNSAGISVIIGSALLLSISGSRSTETNRWQTFRLFAMPFCVSSFSSLIKGQGYFFVFPTRLSVLVSSVLACLAFAAFVFVLRTLRRRVGIVRQLI